MGKTSIGSALGRELDSIDTIHFGEVILSVVAERLGRRAQHSDLRAEPNRLVGPEILELARARLLELVTAGRRSRHIVIESHAVSPVRTGARSTPDDPEYVRALGLDLVVQLYADPGVIEARRKEYPDGRPGLSVEDMWRLEVAQTAVSTFYAATSRCPLCLVDASASPEVVTDAVLEVLETVGVQR